MRFHKTVAGDGSKTPIGGAAGALIGRLSPNAFLVTGYRARVGFDSAKAERFMLARVEEGHFENGQWVFERVWNGDQVDYGLNLTTLPQVLKVKLAAY